MQAIDLLIKMANDEKMPKKVMHEGTIYTYHENERDELARYKDDNNGWLSSFAYLSDEIKIIEEENENNKIKKIELDDIYGMDYKDAKYVFARKINEIIKYLQEKNEND